MEDKLFIDSITLFRQKEEISKASMETIRMLIEGGYACAYWQATCDRCDEVSYSAPTKLDKCPSCGAKTIDVRFGYLLADRPTYSKEISDLTEENYGNITD